MATHQSANLDRQTRQPRQPRQPRPSNRRDQLLDVATTLFRKHGYHGVAINDIAAAAGVTGAAVYRHFSSKQQLLEHAILAALDVLRDATEAALAACACGQETNVRALTHELATVAVARREAIALWRWQGAFLAAANRAEVRRKGAGLLSLAVNALRDHRRQLAAADAELLCLAAASVLGSIADHHVKTGRRRLIEVLAGLAEVALTMDPPRAHARPASAVPSPGPSGASVLRGTRREELLAAATRLFRERGFRAVSIEDIGNAVGLAAPSVYRHFGSKNELLLTASHRMADRLADEATLAVENANGPHDAVRALLSSYVDNYARNRDLVSVYVTEVSHLPSAERAELIRLQRAYVTQATRLLMAARPDLDEAAARITVHAALAIVNDLCRTRWLRERGDLIETVTAIGHAVLGG